MACNDATSNCTDSCDQIGGLFEAASNLVQYRDIIEKWLHGKQNETVQIGGEQVKTLLGLIADIKQLVGVLPDGRTIVLDDKRKVLSVLLADGGGIKVKAEGGLYIDVNDILVLGGGLAKDEDGKIYVDFSQMPTDKFEALLKSIRVPIWLTANKNFYVNGTTGSDTLDEGLGESEEKPFKTLQCCINYISDNYNISSFILTIFCKNVQESGSYIVLKAYQSTSGRISIYGVGHCRVASFQLSQRAIYDIHNFTVDGNYAASGNIYRIRCSYGTINLYNVTIDMSNLYATGRFLDFSTYVQSGGVLVIPSSNREDEAIGLTIELGDGNTLQNILFALDSGQISFSADITVNGNVTIALAFAQALRNSMIVVTESAYAYPGRAPVVTATGTVNGKRYQAQLNAVISVRGKGAEYFPGTEPGVTNTGGQYL